jgi:hypothetical protein
MFFSEHNPPHFHARYGTHKAAIKINDLSLLEGRLPPRVLGLVVEWASKHQQELIKNWERARAEQNLDNIDPLE